MFQFARCRFPATIVFIAGITQYNLRWVASFGIFRITACLRLPETYRCLPRPSSPHLTKSSVHKHFVAWPKTWFSRFIIVVYPQDLKKTLLLDMSTSVKLIICRSSLLLTQQKLSKNVDPRTKRETNLRFKIVELSGIGPLTPCLQSRCSPSWATAPNNGGPEWIRTTDPSLIRAVL